MSAGCASLGPNVSSLETLARSRRRRAPDGEARRSQPGRRRLTVRPVTRIPPRSPGPVGFAAMSLVATTALTKRYPGGVVALDGLTWSSSPGSSASSAPTARARARCCGSSSACSRRPPGQATVLGHDVAHRRHDPAPVRRLHARVRLPAARHHRDRLRRPDGAAVRPARAPGPASAPPRSSATSGCTRSATGRSAAIRPG